MRFIQVCKIIYVYGIDGNFTSGAIQSAGRVPVTPQDGVLCECEHSYLLFATKTGV